MHICPQVYKTQSTACSKQTEHSLEALSAASSVVSSSMDVGGAGGGRVGIVAGGGGGAGIVRTGMGGPGLLACELCGGICGGLGCNGAGAGTGAGDGVGCNGVVGVRGVGLGVRDVKDP